VPIQIVYSVSAGLSCCFFGRLRVRLKYAPSSSFLMSGKYVRGVVLLSQIAPEMAKLCRSYLA
jgi:hypothetical protein